MNVKELLEKAKDGRLSTAEAAQVAGALAAAASTYDRYTLLHILGRGEATSYRSLVETFLESAEDPMLAAIALKTLCSYWGLTSQYLPTVLRFAKGVAWDNEDEVRLVAIGVIGEYLRSANDREALQLLIDILTAPEQRAVIHRTAHESLARAAGRSWSDAQLENRGPIAADASLMEWALSKLDA